MGMGPMASQQLMQLGADVTKVEFARLGDPLKKMPCFGMNADLGVTEVYHQINAGKSLWQFDWRSEQDRHRLKQELEKTDVLIESFLPGTMSKWGLSSAELLPAHPHLIYASISAYGQSDPRSKQMFHEANVMASNGTLSLLNKRDEPLSLHPGPAMTLSFALCAEVIARLFARGSSREPLPVSGRLVDISLDNISMASSVFLWADEVADVPPSQQGHLIGTSLWNRIYPCAGGTSLVVSLPELTLFRRLLKFIGVESDLTAESRCELEKNICEKFLEKSAQQWEQELLMVGVTVTAVTGWNAPMI